VQCTGKGPTLLWAQATLPLHAHAAELRVGVSFLRVCRALMVALSAFDRENLELDILTHPLLNVIYYSLVEVLPTACVLYILRKLPPKRVQTGYQPIPAQPQQP